MKKSLIAFAAAALLFSSCGGSKSSSGTDSTSTTSESASTVQDTLGKSLIAKNDCSTCHREDQKIVGPAFDSVAYKYTATPAVIDTLANKVIKGGSGNWGTVAMLAHPNLSMDDARHMVRYILSLKK